MKGKSEINMVTSVREGWGEGDGGVRDRVRACDLIAGDEEPLQRGLVQVLQHALLLLLQPEGDGGGER